MKKAVKEAVKEESLKVVYNEDGKL